MPTDMCLNRWMNMTKDMAESINQDNSITNDNIQKIAILIMCQNCLFFHLFMFSQTIFTT